MGNRHSYRDQKPEGFRDEAETDKDRLYIQEKRVDTIRSHAIDFITLRLPLQ
jgi:hypothetical protein